MFNARPILLTFMLALGTGSALAQEPAVAWAPRTGDVWVDDWLGDMNRYGARYREPFVDELVRYYGAPRNLVIELLDGQRWQPGDIYYACAIASVLGRSCRHVVDVYQADPGQGWGSIAERLGIKPGSPEFHRLKKGIVPTYDRWARPIDLDADLRADFPGRSKTHAHGTMGAHHAPKAGGAGAGKADGREKAAPDANRPAKSSRKHRPGKKGGNG